MSKAKNNKEVNDKVIRDLFVKLSKVFPSDLYILHNKLIYAGPGSDETINGNYLCILEEKFEDSLKYELNPQKSYYVDNIVEAKDNFKDHVKIVESLSEVENIAHRIRALRELVSNIDEWSSFKETLDENGKEKFLSLFVDKDTIDLVDMKNYTPSVIVGKSLLPLVTEKNYDNLFYRIFDLKDSGLYVIAFDFHFTHFQLYMVYYFIPDEEDDKTNEE